MSSTASPAVARSSRDLLHDYQERAVAFIKDGTSCALWVDMGLGKTITVLTALADLFDRFEVVRALVIAPLRVARTTWPTEIAAWPHVSHLSATVIAGSPADRRGLLDSDGAQIHIINRELVPWLVTACGKDWPYDVVVIDEASSFKSSSAKRFKALRRVLPTIDRVIELTGTPASNGLLDVWSQIFLLDRGERLGKTFSGFRNRYFDSDFHGYSWTIKEGAADEIYDRLRDVCLTLSAEDYLRMPDRIDNMVRVAIPPKARSSYEELEREFLTEIDDQDVAVIHAAALSNKLLQFANGAIYTDDEGAWTAVHDAKLDALESLVGEASGEPLLVAYSYRTDAERIVDRLPQAEMLGRDPETIARWNRGDIPILLAHPASAGHGLNLQHGGRTIVWFGLNWSLELYQQFNGRLHRQGQERPVIVHHIVADDSVDGTVLAALARKDTTQKALLDALKSDIERREA